MDDFAEEYQKCVDSPAYFHNNYCLVKDENGNWVKPNPVTDEQIEEAIKVAARYRKKRFSSSFYKDWLETFGDAKIRLNSNFELLENL